MFPLLAYLLGCGEGSSTTAFCPSFDEFGVRDQTCIDMKKSSVVAKAPSAPQPTPTTPNAQTDSYETKGATAFCPSVDEFGIRDPNCARFR